MTKKAPWTDFVGGPIFEGDTILHPSGQRGKVVCWDKLYEDPSDKWRVKYEDGDVARLCLQIGDKGMAVVTNEETP